MNRRRFLVGFLATPVVAALDVRQSATPPKAAPPRRTRVTISMDLLDATIADLARQGVFR